MTSVSIISGVADRIKYLISQPSLLIISLPSELDSINQSLRKADQETKKSDEFVKLERQIVQLCYDINDVIESMELGIRSKPKGRFSLIKLGRQHSVSSSSSEEDLVSLKKKLVILKNRLDKMDTPASEKRKEKNVTISPAQTTIDQANPESPTASPGEEMREVKEINNTFPAAQTSHQAKLASSTGEDVHPMEGVVRSALWKEDSSVVCIQGENGMGKTTLAKKVFHNRDVRESFQGFAWVPKHHDCQIKKVLHDILFQLLPEKKAAAAADGGGMNEIELAEEIYTFQKDKKCLFVLEDVATVQDWRGIRVALLVQNSSKILITTASSEVAGEATTSKGEVYRMKILTEAECFRILKEKANFSDVDLEHVGKIISDLSQGSPLFAIILGKSFKTADVAARELLLDELDKYRRSQSSEGENQVLQLCYNVLHDELKPCLLYMGQFPEGQDIEVEKLHLLLAAEDLVLPEDSGTRKKIFMQSVRNTLEKLARKKLVEVQENQLSVTKMYKSCQLHEQVRKFCKIKGLNEEFFEIVDFESGKNTKKLALSTARRLAIYLNKYKDGESISFSSPDTVNKIRSLLIFDTHESQQKSMWPSDLKEFIGLRVLDFNGVNFRVRRFPRGLDKLVFLRYLSFRGCCLESFPPSISQFLLLETLDLRVMDCGITIPNIFSKMRRLRHLYLPAAYATTGESNLQFEGLERLELLVNFDTGACKVEDLSKLNNLQILTAISEGNHKDLKALVKYLDDANLQQSSLDIRNFDCYTEDRVTRFIELLKCKTIQSLHIEGQIGRHLPQNVVISPNLTDMIFDGSEIEDDLINVLGKLQNLRNLVLLNNAFVGKIMFISSKFPNLRRLELWNLQRLEKLTFKKGTMPKLSTLVIDKCGYLEKVLMPKALDNRLQLAHGKKGDSVYSVKPLPTISDLDN